MLALDCVSLFQRRFDEFHLDLPFRGKIAGMRIPVKFNNLREKEAEQKSASDLLHLIV